MSGQSLSPSVLERLSLLLMRPVSLADRDRARLHLLDWVGCAVAGAARDTGKAFARTGDATLSSRAFVWGALGNILEMDDVDKRAILHCGPTIIPAALAVLADRPLSVLLDAVVRGYDATIRLGRATGAGHYALWHSTATCGPIGAAAACASVLGFEPRKASHAMALAMSQTSGLWQTRHSPRSSGKQLHTAHAARAGFQGARLAAEGLEGPLDILEGAQGFFAATCPDGRPQEVAFNGGTGWLIHEFSFKPWPACRHAHAAIDAALLARESYDDGDIRVLTYADALKFCDQPKPRSEIEAKFSLQHAVAVAIVRGKPELADFAERHLDREDVARVRERVRVGISETINAAYPAHYGAELHSGGTVFRVPDALGDPENPMRSEDIVAKAKSLLSEGGLNASTAQAVVDFCLTGTGSAGLIRSLLP